MPSNPNVDCLNVDSMLTDWNSNGIYAKIQLYNAHGDVIYKFEKNTKSSKTFLTEIQTLFFTKLFFYPCGKYYLLDRVNFFTFFIISKN